MGGKRGSLARALQSLGPRFPGGGSRVQVEVVGGVYILEKLTWHMYFDETADAERVALIWKALLILLAAIIAVDLTLEQFGSSAAGIASLMVLLLAGA